MTPQSDVFEICDLVSLKRQNVLGLAIDGCSKSILKFICKLKNVTYEHSDLEILRSLFKDDAWTRLRHLPRVNWQVLKSIAREKGWFEFKGIQELLMACDDSRVVPAIVQWSRLVADISRLTKVMKLPDPTPRLKGMRQIGEAMALHDALAERLSRSKREEVEKRYQKPFPTPPLPGNEIIQPILTVGDLLEEGSAMHHCVGSYVERVLDGRCFIYRVAAHERATLEVVMTPDGKCRLGQLKLACNGKVSAETSLMVRRWLETGGGRKLGQEV